MVGCAELSGDDVTSVIITDRAEKLPAPPDTLETGKIRRPEFIWLRLSWRPWTETLPPF